MYDLDKYKIHRKILCIDLKNFYASVECILRDLDPFATPLVVADQEKGQGAVVLAVSPYLKNKGVQSRCRIKELPKNERIIFAKPRMKEYIKYSAKVISVFLDFVSEEDLFNYSIDESFLDITNYLSYYKMNEFELAKKIIEAVLKETKLTVTAGIGPNMLIAKLAMDIEAKKAKDFIAKWEYEDIKDKLWEIEDLSKMWGIGEKTEEKLYKMGIKKIKDIATSEPAIYKEVFGVLGEELWFHTNGIDSSLISEKKNLKQERKSYGQSQILFRDYNETEIKLIILEMIDEVVRRLREENKKTKTIHLGIGYSYKTGGSFSKQKTMKAYTDDEDKIFQNCLEIFKEKYNGNPIRSVSISLSNLISEKHEQLSLFDSENKHNKIKKTIDNIKNKYGKNAIRRASSELEHSTAKKRNETMGGHNE